MVLKIDFHQDSVDLWHLTANGVRTERVTDYTPTLFADGPDRSELTTLQDHVARLPTVANTAIEAHRRGFRHDAEPMLRIDAERVTEIRTVAQQVRQWGDPGEYRFYDVDLSPEFRYCLETDTDARPRDVRPLRVCELTTDDPALADETLSKLTVDGTTATDPSNILELVDERLDELDPDVLVLSHAAIVPRLFELAERLDESDHTTPFALGRRPGYTQRAGRSTYTSYGNVGHSPARYSVPGRVIINEQNSFMWHETNLDGCLDLVRRSGKPLQELGWASIGNVLTAIQIREARRRDVRAAWHSWRHEFFKSMRTLHDADRGGFIFEPEVGLHETVHEIDFASLYPNIMITRNISPETVCCDCHNGEDVPELGYSICEERGYLADVLEPLVTDRQAIKAELAQLEEDNDESDTERIDELQGKSAAIKWILVSCFGYQGFDNATFGRIECHEAINAFAREILLDAKSRLEAAGWDVVHGIVDSLWVTPQPDGPQEPLDGLCNEITDEIGIELEHEAAYEWIAFVPQRTSDSGALTKYFGKEANADRYKYRGIECRQRSTCAYVERVQRELIRKLAESRSARHVVETLQRHLDELARGAVPPEELTITQRVSKPLDQYQQRTRTVAALKRADDAGIDVHPGESVSYVVANDETHTRERVRLGFEIEPEATNQMESNLYDPAFYRDRLIRAAASITSPLGWRQRDIERYLADRTDASLSAYT